MKKTLLPLILVLGASTLAGCGPTSNPTDPTTPVAPSEKIITALNSLKYASHYVDMEQDVAILKPTQPEVCDIYSFYHNNMGYFYSETEKAYSYKTETLFCDLDKETGEPLENTIRRNSTDEVLYFKDEDGTVYQETVTFQNEVVSTTMAFYDEDTGYYQPVIFDSEFKNPWDYITTRDLVENSDGKLTLINEKADFLAECYGAVGLNFITSNKINLDEQGRIIGIDFVINDLVTDTYTRTNTFKITYSGHDTAKLTHLTPSTNNNPELQAAFDSIKNVKNYTYAKEYTYSYGATKDLITGYFTEEEVYFRHHTEDETEHAYTGGDDYDYKAKINEDGVSYTGYEYTLKGEMWDWGIVMLSSSAPYIMDTFEEIGPKFFEINASIFKEIEENVYEIEPHFLRDSGAYFDFGFLGVNSAAMEGGTNKMVITLTADGQIEKIETGFTFMGTEYPINYYLSNIGTTEVPSWSDNPTPLEY